MSIRQPLQCIIPPYIHEHLARSPYQQVRDRAIAALRTGDVIHAVRAVVIPQRRFTAFLSPGTALRRKLREVYDAQQSDQLPGSLVRAEGQPPHTDQAVNEAYDFSGETFDFYEQVFGRNSLDDAGLRLLSSIHVAEVDLGGNLIPMNNGFWNGQQLAYGDGDGIVFQRFTRGLDVVAHELTHGVQSFTSNLLYRGQSGALNEHLSDVFGVLVRQWKLGQSVADADWVIGAEVLVPAATRRGLRDMERPGTAYQNDPDLGSDPQPAHMNNLYTGSRDWGGVHLNSGIPNRAFVLAAQALGGNAWEEPGRIWYNTMLSVTPNTQFSDFAQATVNAAVNQYGRGSTQESGVRKAWQQVGIPVP